MWLIYSSLDSVGLHALPNEFATHEPQIWPRVLIAVSACKSLLPRKPKGLVSMARLFSEGLVVDPRSPIFSE